MGLGSLPVFIVCTELTLEIVLFLTLIELQVRDLFNPLWLWFDKTFSGNTTSKLLPLFSVGATGGATFLGNKAVSNVETGRHATVVVRRVLHNIGW